MKPNAGALSPFLHSIVVHFGDSGTRVTLTTQIRIVSIPVSFSFFFVPILHFPAVIASEKTYSFCLK